MNKTIAIFFAASCSLNATATQAQQAQASMISPLSPIYACADKTNATERLTCFDAAVAKIKAAEARSEIVALDQPRVAAVRREAFGFRIPSLPRFGFGNNNATTATSTVNATTASSPTAQAREEVEDEQIFAVVRVGQAGNRVAIFLENGNVWHLTEAGELNAPRQTPFNVRIRTAAMGSFMLNVEGRNKGYRVRRVQ
jgi:hypothetical protein